MTIRHYGRPDRPIIGDKVRVDRNPGDTIEGEVVGLLRHLDGSDHYAVKFPADPNWPDDPAGEYLDTFVREDLWVLEDEPLRHRVWCTWEP